MDHLIDRDGEFAGTEAVGLNHPQGPDNLIILNIYRKSIKIYDIKIIKIFMPGLSQPMADPYKGSDGRAPGDRGRKRRLDQG